MTHYSGTLRISNPKTLQAWIDRGWYKDLVDEGYKFNVGCGRFKIDNEVCTCSQCRTRTRPELVKIIEKYNTDTLQVK